MRVYKLKPNKEGRLIAGSGHCVVEEPPPPDDGLCLKCGEPVHDDRQVCELCRGWEREEEQDD
jgi:hypothetical protein